MDKKFMDSLEEVSKVFNEIHNEIQRESEEYWNSLSKEDQLKVFCAVSRRIYKAEIEEQCSYRGTLYGVFEFGPEAYAQAQMSGYLEIHNSIVSEDHDKKLLTQFCEKYKISDIETKVIDFLK